MSEPDPHRFEEFNVDHRAVEVESLVRRIVSERERRITAEFPAWRQVQLIAAGVVLMFDKTLTERRTPRRRNRRDSPKVVCAMRDQEPTCGRSADQISSEAGRGPWQDKPDGKRLVAI